MERARPARVPGARRAPPGPASDGDRAILANRGVTGWSHYGEALPGRPAVPPARGRPRPEQEFDMTTTSFDPLATARDLEAAGSEPRSP